MEFLKDKKRIIGGAVFVSLIVLGVCAAGGQSYAQEKLPVTLSIRAKERHICLGQSMTVIASIRNLSPRPVVIDPKGIGTRPRFFWDHKIGPGEYEGGTFTEVATRRSLKSDRLVVVYPSQFYSTELGYPLKRDWLPGGGKYEFRAGYSQYQNAQYKGFDVWIGDVDSTKIDISVKECKE